MHLFKLVTNPVEVPGAMFWLQLNIDWIINLNNILAILIDMFKSLNRLHEQMCTMVTNKFTLIVFLPKNAFITNYNNEKTNIK